MIVSLVSLSTWTRKVGSSRMKRFRALDSLSWSARLLGEIGQVDDRLGGVDALQREVRPLVAVGVAGGALDAHDGDDVAGAGRVDVLLLVGVDAEDPADPALLPLAAVAVELALLERPLVDPHVRDLAERLLDELEGHRHQRARRGRRRGGPRPCRCRCPWRRSRGRAGSAGRRRRRRAGAARPCSCRPSRPGPGRSGWAMVASRIVEWIRSSGTSCSSSSSSMISSETSESASSIPWRARSAALGHTRPGSARGGRSRPCRRRSRRPRG